MVKVIEGLEKGAKAKELSYIDISGMLGNKAGAGAAEYGKMLEVVEGMESKQKGGAERQQAAKQAQQAQGLEANKLKQGGAPSAGNERVKEEMQKMIGGLPEIRPKFGEFKIRRTNAGDLVLPNLPISDQIQELERIIAVLKENVLNKEQRATIGTELEGLDRYVRKLKKESAKEKKGRSKSDQSLWEMRDQRLREAGSLFRSG
jgi:hypothetical protein